MAVYSLLIKIFFIQVLVIGGIVFALLHVLKRHLIEAAIQRFETLFTKEAGEDLEEIVLVVQNDLSPEIIQRIEQSALKKFKRPVKMTIQKNKWIKGGIIIKLKNITLDYSVATRLKEGFSGNA